MVSIYLRVFSADLNVASILPSSVSRRCSIVDGVGITSEYTIRYRYCIIATMRDSYNTLFTFGMWWRIAYGATRLAIGVTLLSVVGTPLSVLFYRLTAHELAMDPDNSLLLYVGHSLTHHNFMVTYFLAGYLIFWGVVDMVLSYNVLRNKLWAFPASLALISFFIVYEMFRFTHTHSAVLLGIIVVDLALVLLIGHHYRILLRNKSSGEGVVY